MNAIGRYSIPVAQRVSHATASHASIAVRGAHHCRRLHNDGTGLLNISLVGLDVRTTFMLMVKHW